MTEALLQYQTVSLMLLLVVEVRWLHQHISTLGDL